MTPDPDPPSCIGVLLAAGAGSRYRQAGGAGNKLHATLADGMPIAAHAAARLSAAVARVVALVAPDDAFLARRLADLGCVVLPAPAADGPEGGMGSTLAAAMQWLLAHGDGHTHALVALGDMPWVAPETLRAVAAQPSAHAVAAPLVQGRRGHPVRFARAMARAGRAARRRGRTRDTAPAWGARRAARRPRRAARRGRAAGPERGVSRLAFSAAPRSTAPEAGPAPS